MKGKRKLFIFLLLAGIFISCSSEDKPGIVYEAKMISFGFYAEDNEDIIFQDYIVESVTGNINIALPREVDKSKLVARFAVTENDVVKVGEVVQQSGVTANNFTVPVDYIVSEGTANTKYTVTITNAAAFVWTSLPPIVVDSARAVIMRVNPTNNKPYVFYSMHRAASAEQALGSFVLNDGTWQNLGQVSDGRVNSYYDATFNSQGAPYVSFGDYTTEPQQKASVKSYDGTQWNYVGEKGATGNKVSFQTIRFSTDNKLMLFATYDATDGAMTRRELSVNTFEGGSWAKNATIPGRASSLISYLLQSDKEDDAIYVGVFNAVSPNSFSVYRLKDNAWQVLVDQWADPNGTGLSIRDFDIASDKDGNVYIAFADNSSEGVYKLRIVKYDSAQGRVLPVGDYLTSVTGGLFNFDLAVSPFGIPYVAYRNESSFPCVTSFDNETQNWNTPHQFEAEVAGDLSIGFTPGGVGYVTYLKGNRMVSHKYDAPGN